MHYDPGMIIDRTITARRSLCLAGRQQGSGTDDPPGVDGRR